MLSWVKESDDLSAQNIVLGSAAGPLDGLPHKIFVVVEKNQAKWYLKFVDEYLNIYPNIETKQTKPKKKKKQTNKQQTKQNKTKNKRKIKKQNKTKQE